MKIYNTLNKKIEDFKPQEPPEVKIYTCGPTVYDHSHIGHWFNYVRMDMLIRTLKANNFNPFWVMNVTDVGHLTSDQDEGEDKIQKKANKEHKSAWDIAKYFTKEFFEESSLLNITTPTKIVKATDHIQDQIEFVQKLSSKGYIYEIENDGLYFDTSKFPNYAQFANLDLDEQQPGKRVNFNIKKRNIADFAVWKFSPKNSKRDMEWEAPFGKGFPGWHLECSVMSMKYLGETLDIHSGGIDHIPVHHTNEIAQSESLTGKPLANYWFHSNHVTINGEKISKSLGNGITLKDIIAKNFDPLDLRMHILESHYQNQSKFSFVSLKAARERYKDFKAFAVIKYQLFSQEQGVLIPFNKIINQLVNFLSDNLNTPLALTYFNELISSSLNQPIKNSFKDFNNFLSKVDELLGLNLNKIEDISNDQKNLIKLREQARENKNYEQSDKIRQILEDQGIIVEDHSFGSRWRQA